REIPQLVRVVLPIEEFPIAVAVLVVAPLLGADAPVLAPGSGDRPLLPRALRISPERLHADGLDPFRYRDAAELTERGIEVDGLDRAIADRAHRRDARCLHQKRHQRAVIVERPLA